MTYLNSPVRLLASICVLSLAAFSAPSANEMIAPVCPLAIHEASLDLEEAILDVQIYRSTFTAFVEIYEIIAALVEGDAINKMTHLKARYDRDAAKLNLERADLLLIRQEALIEQLRLACDDESREPDGDRARELERAYLRYRQADCDQQAKAIEVTETNLEFNQKWLASVLDLRDQVSTKPDVIRARLNVKLEEQRRDDAIRRTEACRAAMKELAGGDSP
jgi:hypothetical protein